MKRKRIRTQLYLDAEQKSILEERSRATGKSMGNLVREAIDEVYFKQSLLERPLSPTDSIWDFIGKGRSKEGDLSTKHDEYLYGFKEE